MNENESDNTSERGSAKCVNILETTIARTPRKRRMMIATAVLLELQRKIVKNIASFTYSSLNWHSKMNLSFHNYFSWLILLLEPISKSKLSRYVDQSLQFRHDKLLDDLSLLVEGNNWDRGRKTLLFLLMN